jgi:hypothetical protein
VLCIFGLDEIVRCFGERHGLIVSGAALFAPASAAWECGVLVYGWVRPAAAIRADGFATTSPISLDAHDACAS